MSQRIAHADDDLAPRTSSRSAQAVLGIRPSVRTYRRQSAGRRLDADEDLGPLFRVLLIGNPTYRPSPGSMRTSRPT